MHNHGYNLQQLATWNIAWLRCHSMQHFLGGVKRLSKQVFCFYYPCMWFVVHIVAQWLAVLHQGRKVPSLNQTTFMTQSLRVLHASTRVLSVYSHFLPQSKNTSRLTSKAKLTALVKWLSASLCWPYLYPVSHSMTAIGDWWIAMYDFAILTLILILKGQ